eukprot:TRINITY_DN9639_c0_g1_i1.p2 TRINITY_DN9639_c0_g1~~TRINITY_DN9639_c0_g1_i1.p2  ORF type:complete len:109 (-),score=16.07 TRINITY_DN9639_c0_g1_i1:205-531(-)
MPIERNCVAGIVVASCSSKQSGCDRLTRCHSFTCRLGMTMTLCPELSKLRLYVDFVERNPLFVVLFCGLANFGLALNFASDPFVELLRPLLEIFLLGAMYGFRSFHSR